MELAVHARLRDTGGRPIQRSRCPQSIERSDHSSLTMGVGGTMRRQEALKVRRNGLYAHRR